MVTIFWDAWGKVHIDHLQSGRRVKGNYHAISVDRYNDDLKKNDCNGPRRKSLPTKTMQDAALGEYFVFLNLKKLFNGNEIWLVAQTNAYFGSLCKSYFWRAQNIGKTLDDETTTQRRQSWEIECFFCRKIVFLQKVTDLSKIQISHTNNIHNPIWKTQIFSYKFVENIFLLF